MNSVILCTVSVAFTWIRIGSFESIAAVRTKPKEAAQHSIENEGRWISIGSARDSWKETLYEAVTNACEARSLIGFANYVLLRIYGSLGLYYTVRLGGLVNSTATRYRPRSASRWCGILHRSDFVNGD